MDEICERFLATLEAKDWKAMAATLDPALEWHGPKGDRTDRAVDYIEVLQRSVAPLVDYRVDALCETTRGTLVMIELVQRFEMGGSTKVVPEVMVFDVDQAAGRIRRLSVYWREADH